MTRLQSICTGAAFLFAAAPAQAQTFTVDFSGLYMSRAEGDAGALAEEEGGGPTVVDESDLTGDWGFGGEVSLAYRSGPWGGELRGFLLHEIEGNTGFVSDGTDLTILTDPTTSYGLSPGLTFDASLSTDLGGGEANLLYAVAPGVELYVGPRYVRLDEELRFFGDFGEGGSEEDIWGVDNSMFGAQIGGAFDVAAMAGASWPVKPMLRLGAGLYRTHIDGDFDILIDGEPIDDFPVSDSSTETSYSLEADLSLHYDVSPTASIFAGYRLLWLGQVGLAPDQVAGTTSYNAVSDYNVRTGSVLFHGFRAGGEIRF